MKKSVLLYVGVMTVIMLHYQNCASTRSAHPALKVQKQTPKMFSDEFVFIEDVEARLGERIQIDAGIGSDVENARFVWYHNDKVIQETPVPMLEIKETKPEHNGKYIVKYYAGNKLLSESSANLKIE